MKGWRLAIQTWRRAATFWRFWPQIVEAEPDVPAGSVIIGDDIVMAAQAGMDAFDHELQETKAAATAEIDLS
ncbi:hypothetical protein RAH32_21445 [Paracoccus sp. WLY502]|uniref:hypothetical protein n=1 Tax=Paracoccus yibinensis TaxID=3068891 RepID=UPI00279648CB|nr:hypothetical protein [Paracoccus sp. WLY502]MDQ1902970.1 hypothetical protein [Paracoccus sp. WLY502]